VYGGKREADICDGTATHEWKRIETSERAKQSRLGNQPTTRLANKTPVGKQNQSSTGKPHLPPLRNTPTRIAGARRNQIAPTGP
jgi:hypothetical protein